MDHVSEAICEGPLPELLNKSDLRDENGLMRGCLIRETIAASPLSGDNLLPGRLGFAASKSQVPRPVPQFAGTGTFCSEE
jgi:hypothetical protein